MLCLILCFVALFSWLIPKYFRYHRRNKLLQCFPTTDAGFLGSLYAVYRVATWKWNKDVTTFIEELGQMHSKCGCFVFWIIHRPLVVVKKPEYAEVIMSREIHKSSVYDCLRSYFGDGLVTSSGTLWKNHRKLLTPAFHFRILEEFIPVMNNQAKILVEVLTERSRCEPWLDTYPIIGRCALDIICETSMGIQLRSQRGNHPEYALALNEIQSLAIYRIMYPLNQVDSIFYRTAEGKQSLKYLNTLLSFTKQAFEERKNDVIQHDACRLCQVKYYNNNNNNNNEGIYTKKSQKPVPLMDLLLHFHLHEKIFSEQEVQDEVNTFMAGGYETTALTMMWTLYLLGLHPKVQEKVHVELMSIFGSDQERDVTKDDMSMMKYLECVIKESLRVCSTIPMIVRFINEDISIGDNFVIPRGTECVIPISMIHHDKNLFPRPERFIPERFLLEQAQRHHAFSFIPFSAGPRSCIGQRYAMNEMKIVLSAILRCFSVKSLDPQDKISVNRNLCHKPQCPIRITFEPRFVH